jgi:transposase
VRTIHMVLDNSSIHKGKQAQAWLASHPRFLRHFLPTHCSWMKKARTVLQHLAAQAPALL